MPPDIFEYVLFHFQRLFHLPEPLDISYGLDHRSRLQITCSSGNFFNSTQAHPQSVIWKEWEGTRLPLFFENTPERDWFSNDRSGNVVVQYDLIASAFFLLSGWQEFHSQERDQFGRYPYAASMQAQHGFVALPVVNYYFRVLQAALEKAYGKPITPKKWAGKAFATCLTHDVDYLQSAWKVKGKPALLQGNVFLFLKLAFQKIRGQDAWFNLPLVESELQKIGATSTFYFLPERARYQGHPNADYAITAPLIQKEMQRLAKAGHEISLHGSHGAGSLVTQLEAEKSKMPWPVKGNRFHYLRFDYARSPGLLEEAGFMHDSSLGFAEHFGFRNSFCHPFRLFDFKKNQMSPVWELPLNLMDITLHHPNYLQLTPPEVLPAITPMLEEIRRFQGVFTLLWHNENFSPYGLPEGLQLFQDITAYLQVNDSAFLTASQAIEYLQET